MLAGPVIVTKLNGSSCQGALHASAKLSLVLPYIQAVSTARLTRKGNCSLNVDHLACSLTLAVDLVVHYFPLHQRLAQLLALCVPTHITKQQYNAAYDPVLRIVAVNAKQVIREKVYT